MRVEDFLRLFEASGVSLKEVYDKDDLSQYDSYMAVDGEIVGFGIKNFDLSGIIRDILGIRSLRYLLIANTNISVFDFADTNLTNLQSLNVSSNGLLELPKELFNLTNLQSLDISRNGLSELPKEPFNLTNLQSLNVSYNRLLELPKELFNLTNLHSLNVSYNRLLELPKELFNLTNLQSLNVSRNELLELPKELFNLTNLQSLNVSYNRLLELPKELFNLTNLQSLNIAGNELSQLPKKLFNLTSLQSLNVSGNRLSELPKELFSLTNLQSLDVSWSGLSELPKELFNLTSLQSLNVSSNELSQLPKELFNLTSLQSLNIAGNELSQLPKELFNLTSLQSLNIAGNELSQLPKKLFNLANLQNLDVSDNQLSQLPKVLFSLINLQRLNISGNRLSELPKEIGYLKRLTYLGCRSSNIKTFPNEIVSLKELRHILIDEKSFDPEYVEALKSGVKNLQNFISQKIKYNVEKLYEAKMLIVGEPGAGKTSLMNKILDREYTLPTSKEDISTIGVDIKSKEFYCDEADTIRFRVNMWDFGGQQIQYLAHQFFLTESSLYVLVSDDRKQHTVFDYWFYIINLLSDNSPILVVLNEINHESVSDFKLSSFSSIFTTHSMEQLSVDLSVMDDGRYDVMVKKIESMLKALPHIGRELPKKWVEIRRDIAEQYNGSYYMNLSDFKNICEKHGLLDEERKVLSRHFHNLGIFLHYTDDIGGLENYIFLNPEWLMDGVYSVLSDKSVVTNKGRFSKDWFFGFLKNHQNGYSDEMQKAILQLMLKDKFELCYRIKDEGEYISPQLLPHYDNEELYWDDSKNIYYTFKYEFMPRGILSRLIVRLSDLLDGDLAWREMVVLKKGGARAKIEEKISDKSINISIMGDRFSGVELLYDIKRELESLHAKSFKNVKYKEFLPCVCGKCSTRLKSERWYFELDTINLFLGEQKETIGCYKSAENVSIHRLISNVGIFEARYKDKKGFDGMPDIHINIKDSFVQKQNVSATANVAVSVNSQINNAISDLASLKKELAKLQDGLDKGMATKAEEIFVALKKLRDENKDKEITEDDIAESGIVGEVEEFLDGVGKVVNKTEGIVDGGNKIIERATKFYESVKNMVGGIDLKALGDIFGA